MVSFESLILNESSQRSINSADIDFLSAQMRYDEHLKRYGRDFLTQRRKICLNNMDKISFNCSHYYWLKNLFSKIHVKNCLNLSISSATQTFPLDIKYREEFQVNECSSERDTC